MMRSAACRGSCLATEPRRINGASAPGNHQSVPVHDDGRGPGLDAPRARDFTGPVEGYGVAYAVLLHERANGIL